MGQKGFFTDTTLCIGCKACEVACKQWNQLPDDGFQLHRHVLRQHAAPGRLHLAARGLRRAARAPAGAATGLGDFSWLMISDVCKHCQRAGCLEACPTGAIIRTEFDTVYVQPDVCNGCGYCVVACPFGVIDRREDDGRAWKCTLCYDRLRRGHDARLRQGLPHRVHPVRRPGRAARAGASSAWSSCTSTALKEAYLYGADAESQPGTGGLNAFFLLVDKPEVYNLPPGPGGADEEGPRGLGLDGAGARWAWRVVALGRCCFGREVTRG